MKACVPVQAAGLTGEAELKDWLQRALKFVSTLSAK